MITEHTACASGENIKALSAGIDALTDAIQNKRKIVKAMTASLKEKGLIK